MSEQSRTSAGPDLTGCVRFASPGHFSAYRCPRCSTQATSLLGWRRRQFKGAKQFLCASCVPELDAARAGRDALDRVGVAS